MFRLRTDVRNTTIWISVLLCCVALLLPAVATEGGLQQRTPTSRYGTSFDNGQFFGGGANETLWAMTHATNGDLIFCGSTTSMNIGTVGAAYSQHAGSDNPFNEFVVYDDAFVTKLSGTTGAVLFTTYLGGTNTDSCREIAIDSTGDIVIAGVTKSDDFPIVNGFDTTFAGGGSAGSDPGYDAFVAKLSADGSTVVFSSYLGGDDYSHFELKEDVRGIAIAPDDSIFLTGTTNAPDFPSTFLIDGRECLEGQSSGSSSEDSYLVKLSSNGALEYSSCLGGERVDRTRDISINAAGRVIIAGYTSSFEFALIGATYVDLPDGLTNYDGFVLEFDDTTRTVEKSLRIGGSFWDAITHMKLATDGTILLGGFSYSHDFPTTAGAYQENIVLDPFNPDFSVDAIVLSIPPTLAGVNFSTYIGAELPQWVGAFEVDDQNQIWFSSGTENFELPTFNAPVAVELKELSGEVLLGPETMSANAIATAYYNSTADDGLLFARNGQNYVAYVDGETPDIYWIQPTGPATGDSRTIAVPPGNVWAAAIGNFGGPNHYYGSILSEPYEFGANDSNTTHLSMYNDGLIGGLIFEANEGQVNNAFSYRYLDIGGSISYFGSFGEPLDETVGLVSQGPGVAEAIAPNLLRFYNSDLALTGEYLLDGMVIAELSSGYWSLPGMASNSALLVSNSAGPSEIVKRTFDHVTGEYSLERTVVDVTETSFKSMMTSAYYPSRLLALDDDSLHEYSFNVDGSVSKVGEYLSTSGATSFAKDYDPFNSNVIMNNPEGPAVYRHRSRDNMFLGALRADGSDLVFGAHFGGDGMDTCPCKLSLAPGGELFFGATTHASNFSGVTELNSTVRQAVITTLNYPLDNDQDSVSDLEDNCQLVANPLQQDTNSDGIGNACDPDLNDDDFVNFIDLNLLRLAFFSAPGDAQWNPHADFNSDLAVNFADLVVMRSYFFGPPGPAAEPL